MHSDELYSKLRKCQYVCAHARVGVRRGGGLGGGGGGGFNLTHDFKKSN